MNKGIPTKSIWAVWLLMLTVALSLQGICARADSMTEEQANQEQPKENPDEIKFIEELNLQDFQEYEDLFKLFCDYKAGKVEKPKLKDYIAQMRNNVANLLEVNIDQVSIKAGTNEGMGAVGEGLAVEASCTILLRRVD